MLENFAIQDSSSWFKIVYSRTHKFLLSSIVDIAPGKAGQDDSGLENYKFPATFDHRAYGAISKSDKYENMSPMC